MDPDRLEAASHRYRDIDAVEGDPFEVLKEIIRVCELAPDDEERLWIAILLLDPLLDTHWSVIEQSSSLR